MQESFIVLTHGVISDQLYYILKNEKIVPSRYFGVVSMSINGYFNLFAYRDAVFIFDFNRMLQNYEIRPVFYTQTERAKYFENYGLAPLNLFWETEAFTREDISIYDATEVIIVEENGTIAIPQELIDMLQDYGIPTRVGTREDTFYGRFGASVKYLVELMRRVGYPSATVSIPPKGVLWWIEEYNAAVARVFGLETIYEREVMPILIDLEKKILKEEIKEEIEKNIEERLRVMK